MKTSNRVVVVGSANQDLTSYTKTLPHLGETVMGETFETSCGGKGANQACAAASLAISPVSMICRVGEDVFGKDLLENFRNKGVQVNEKEAVLPKGKDGKPVSSGVASIVVDTNSGDNMIIVTPGANHELLAQDVETSLTNLPDPPSVVVVQLEILPEAALQALKMGKKLGAVTVFNPAPAPDTFSTDEFYIFSDILVPNESELRKICGVTEEACKEDKDFEEEAKKLLLERGVGQAVIVTLGARGAMVVEKQDQGETQTTFVNAPPNLPCKDDPVADTIGAGDAFCGALSTYLSAGIELKQAATLACGFASMSVRRQGASYPTADELPDCLQIDKFLVSSREAVG